MTMTKRKLQIQTVPVVGCHENGTRYWYTGKAGEAFVSTDRKDALEFTSVAAARRKAAVLNKALPETAIYFSACVGDLAKEAK